MKIQQIRLLSVGVQRFYKPVMMHNTLKMEKHHKNELCFLVVSKFFSIKILKMWILSFEVLTLPQKNCTFFAKFQLSQRYRGASTVKIGDYGSDSQCLTDDCSRLLSFRTQVSFVTILAYLASMYVLSSICSKVFCFHGVLALGTLSCPSPISLRNFLRFVTRSS